MYKNKSNLEILKNYMDGIRPYPTFGYTSPAVIRKQGDIWQDHRGITWEQRDGYKTRVNKQANIIHEAINQKCKICKCDVRWGNRFDRLFFSKTRMCQDCLVDYENKLHMVGIFDVYERYKVLSNEIGFFRDAKAKLKETVEFFSQKDTSIEILCNSTGFREKFHGTNKDQILKDAKKDLTAVRRHLREITKKMKAAKDEFKQKAFEFKIETYA